MHESEKQFACLLAALLMQNAHGSVVNALNLAQGLMEEADKRWPDSVPPEEQ